MDRNNFMSRIKVVQIVDYNKLFLIQRKVENINEDTVKELATILDELSEEEKQELEKIYKEQIERLENKKSTSKNDVLFQILVIRNKKQILI